MRRALQSILDANVYHNDWHLGFGDDGSRYPGGPIVREVLAGHLDQVTIRETGDTLQQKMCRGIAIGKHGNEAITTLNAEIGITLSDDDALVPTYLRDLSAYFESHPSVTYAYSKVYIYNPLLQPPTGQNLNSPYNCWDTPINPVNKLDASQVAFRLEPCKRLGVRFPENTENGPQPMIENLDAAFFQQLYDHFGEAVPTGIVGQYKGVHDYQLLWHKKKTRNELHSYMKSIDDLAGTIL